MPSKQSSLGKTMRRSKIKATVCVGRRKPDNSRKTQENVQAIDESIVSTEMSDIGRLKSVQQTESEDTILSICPNTVGPTPPENNLKPVQVEKPSNSISSLTDSPSKPKSTVISETSNQTSPVNRSLISRSKIRAVPKFRNRNTGSNVALAEEEVKCDAARTTDEMLSESISYIQQSTQNKPETESPTEKSASQLNPILPTSPCKRSRIKAVPVLGNRKTFSGASDSEDGKSVSSRNRTDSQSSTISTIQDTVVEQFSPTTKKVDGNSDTKRKFRKSESAKKMAEARREFAKKYVDGKPDYKKLTMMDLIFYNPTSNPMRYDKKKAESTEETIDQNKQTEEVVDNPAELEDSPEKNDEQMNKSDDEDDIIAPRIKIGPTGEIILDEKSLVIENKKVKKAQEAIEKSKAVDGDLDRPYGVYKRFKRSKDWTQSETVQFYRALSTVGTDFTLMTELFPKRTRRELKVKFKKEERINRALVDQAIMKPCNFIYEELKKEFEMMEIETLEIEQQHKKEQELNKKKQNKRSSKFVNMTQGNCSPDNTQENTNDMTTSKSMEPVCDKPIKKRGRKPKKPKLSKTPKKLDILSALSESDPSDLDSSDSEEVLVWNPTQTRYGRKTKRREIFEPNIDQDEDVIIQKKIRKPNVESESTKKPGSLMMVSSETPDGQPVVKIYMVTDDKATNGEENEINHQNLLPIAMIRTDHTDDEAEGKIVENNYTIPADTEENLIEQKAREIAKNNCTISADIEKNVLKDNLETHKEKMNKGQS